MSFQRNCERLRAELIESLCGMNHDALVQYAREHRECPDFLSTKLCRCEHASECWLLDLALEEHRPAFLDAFIEACPELLSKDVFSIHCAIWAFSIKKRNCFRVRRMVKILRANPAMDVELFYRTCQGGTSHHCVVNDYDLQERFRFLSHYSLMGAFFCQAWLEIACAEANDYAVHHMLKFIRCYHIKIDEDAARTYLAQMCVMGYGYFLHEAAMTLARLGSGDVEILETLVYRGSHPGARSWFFRTMRGMQPKEIEVAVCTTWLPAIKILLSARATGSSTAEFLTELFSAGHIDLQRNSLLGEELYSAIYKTPKFYDRDTDGLVRTLLQYGFDPELCWAPESGMILFELIWHGYDVAEDAVAWTNLVECDNYIHTLAHVLQIWALSKHDADDAFNLYCAFYKTFSIYLPAGAPATPPRMPANLYPTKVLELARAYITHSDIEPPPSLPAPSLEEARRRTIEMWRRIWRERCFQIATAFRSMRLPDECFHKIAKALAPALIRRYLPRYLPDRVFMAVRRRSLAKENEQ